MTHASVRMIDEEKELLESYAKIHNKCVTVVLKDSFLKNWKMKSIFEHLKSMRKKEFESFTPFEQMVKELDLAYKIL